MGGPKIKKNVQVDASLDKPIDKDAPPTIFTTALTPEYATAALNLSVDFLKQQQGECNKYLISHPVVLSSIVLILTIYMTPKFTYPSNEDISSVSSFLYHLFLLNKRNVFSALIITLICTSFLFTGLSRISDSFFKSKIDRILQSNGELVFNTDLKALQSDTQEKNRKKKNTSEKDTLENTHIVVYRNTPISLISISKNLSLDNVININSIGARKVYLKSGILEDLLDWSMIRSRTLCSASKKKSDTPLKVIVEVYSFDDKLKKTLKKRGFSFISSTKIVENRLLGGLFGVKKELWGVQFHFASKDKN
ncbi:Pho86p NDAI_0G06070 [Naumovozyma dairenensis CBS 421]|uniref:Inorganic phosphate transporter PHO86 n=1 Tax=Naumovozyma dairenensis (strain ATCC 10597 / BCRC 20456 / CBS 421 / NBRC 0211 / NRRL Y-12639) TaxID=1071378 RepID=J7SBV0_NAUDC|nr:hypothetical protein NDAI_0G06070 [Naumovozyma dairenensis CBS 421]CCK73590.1 hypothetical protein NDAI_0G06070 [Naumovozyma dairenensis CBS 421]